MGSFNIRVYCILQHQGKILVLTEPFSGEIIHKFPGGGLELGEGTIDCLRREILEELNLQITNVQHLYTQDFYLASRFNQDNQILLIYYTANVANFSNFRILEPDIQEARWLSPKELRKSDLSLPTDQLVLDLFKSTLSLENNE